MHYVSRNFASCAKQFCLQSSRSRKIDLYSGKQENKSQVFTKAVVTYERIDVQTRNLYHCVGRELKNRSLGTVSFSLLLCITTNRGQSMTKE